MAETIEIIHINKNDDPVMYKWLDILLKKWAKKRGDMFFDEMEGVINNKRQYTDAWLNIRRGSWADTDDKNDVITIEYGQAAQ